MKLTHQRLFTYSLFLFFNLFLSGYSLELSKKSNSKSLFASLLGNTSDNSTSEKQVEKEGPKPGNQTSSAKSENASDEFKEWFSIASSAFKNPLRYPQIKGIKEVQVSAGNKRVNPSFKAPDKNNRTEHDFYFYLQNGYLYYYETDSSNDIVDSILFSQIKNSTLNCFDVVNFSGDNFSLCAAKRETKWKWYCEIRNQLNAGYDINCPKAQESTNTTSNEVIVNKKNKTVIYIPTASPMCNENWNYKSNGEDWNCICKDGWTQSPINLPSPQKAVLNSTLPQFMYSRISSQDLSLKNKANIKLQYEDGMLKLKAQEQVFGRIMLDDGSFYTSSVIHFHTPSEHLINGKKYDMEMQVIHQGVSKGDINKQIVLSFLFKSTPGVENRFINSWNVYDWPNKLDTERIVTAPVFIPNVFVSEDEAQPMGMMPFSFYSYEGSITSPPCTERTLVIVAKDPIPITSIAIGLIKEALNNPDLIDMANGDVILPTEKTEDNTRKEQDLNGRVVRYFDNEKFGCPNFKKKNNLKKNEGHYEKRPVTTLNYMYVQGNKPSGVPGSFVVTEDEIKNKK